MNAFRGIEATTGFDYDAERFDRVRDQLLDDDDFCARFLREHVDCVDGQLNDAVRDYIEEHDDV